METFLDRYFRRSPLAQPGTVAPELLDWPLLASVLASDPEIMVVARGELLPFPRPRDLDELRAYFRIGVGLALRHTERCDASLRAIADAFSTELGTSHVQMFVTPGGTHSFGWHYDDEDVFIAQTRGAKHYYLRPNTICGDRPACAREFTRFADETSPVYDAHLLAGDFLYVPSRWWHMARCREDALSISVGVSPRSGLQRALLSLRFMTASSASTSSA
jgi:50S ribosomal protein L16 3-hydroxylase